MTDRRDRKPGDADPPTEGDLDEALAETFPSSDPAVSTGTTGAEHPGEKPAKPPERQPGEGAGPRGKRPGPG